MEPSGAMALLTLIAHTRAAPQAPEWSAMSSPPTVWNRTILHADMDAFYASVEQLDNPHLRGKPLLIGVDHPRAVVSTASYEARPFGVGSAMPMVEAKRKCPQAIIVPPRMQRYAEVSERIMAVFHDFSPSVEPLSLDEAFVDLTGAERLLGPPEAVGRRLKAAVKAATGGLNVSVGVSGCKYVAKVASDVQKPDGLTIVPPWEMVAFLAPLPVSRLWGVGAHGQELLRRLDLRTIADVAAADPRWLRERLGNLGSHIYALAHADDPRPVVSDREAKSISSEETVDVNVIGRAQLEPYLLRAADRVGRRLRRAGLCAGGVRIRLKTAKFQNLTRQVALRPQTAASATLYAEGCKLLDHLDIDQPFRLVGLGAYDLRPESAPTQGLLFGEPERKKNAQLDRALDSLRSRFGKDAVQRGSDVGVAARFGLPTGKMPEE